MDNKFPMLAKTFRGLEEVLRDELISLGAENVEIGNRMVTFEGDLEMLYKANLCLRTALKVLIPVEKFSASDPDELYDYVRDIEWEKYLTPETTFAIDATVNSEEFPHSKFVTYRVKDGIVDHFMDKYGRRPSIRVNGADMEFNVHISDSRVTISLDSSGAPLNQRGYRVASTPAPINEVLAAGIILKTGWKGDSIFVDPMCGSGTFLIEAALIVGNINPGIFRKEFAFEKWKNFDRDLFESLYNDDSAERTPAFKIYGGDIDPEAVAVTRRNIHEAHVEDMVEVVCKPFANWDAPEGDPGILVTNPPYGERLKPDDMEGLFHEIGTVLKRRFQGYHAWILGYDDTYFSSIGLKPSVKFPILNGPLECTLREYVLFDGSYSDFRDEGGSVRNESFSRIVKPKVHRLSDEEWREETRKYGHDDRKPHRDDRDRKLRRDDRDRKPRRDDRDRKPRRDDRDRKPRRDDRDRKPRRDDRDWKPRRDDRDRKPRRDDKRRDSGYTTLGRGPRLDESSATVISPNTMRSRKGWKKKQTNE